jgi:hypothetical protein
MPMVSFIQALMIFAVAQFVLITGLLKFNRGLRLGEKANLVAKHLSKAILIVFIAFVAVTAYAVMNETLPAVWPFLYVSLVGIILFDCVVNLNKRPLTTVLALCLPVLVAIVSMAIAGPMPVGSDEGRFAGYAYRIIQDGKWQPNVYVDNPFYQFFNIVPYLLATLSMITGLDVVYFVHPIAVILVRLVMSLCLYVVLKHLIPKQMGNIAVLGPILLLSIPPLAISDFIPSTLAVTFYLGAMAFLCVELESKYNNMRFLLIVLISIIGILTHPTYPLLLISTLVPMSLAFRSHKQKSMEHSYLRTLTFIVLVLAFLNWSHTIVLDQLAYTGKTFFQTLDQLVTGAITPFSASKPIWYAAAPFQLAYSWTLPIGFAGAYVISNFAGEAITAAKVKRMFGNLRQDWRTTIAIVGLFLLGAALILKTSFGGWNTRYFYSFFLLLIPASVLVIGKIASRRRVINIVIIVLAVAMASFFAMQDPALFPGGNDVLLQANRRSYVVAETFASNASLNIEYVLEPRVAIPFDAMAASLFPELFYPSYDLRLFSAAIIVVNLDNIGSQWFAYSLYKNPSIINGVINNTFNIIYDDGSYKAWYTTSVPPKV